MDDFKRALQLLEYGQFKEACSILDMLLNGEPNDVDLLYNLGMEYIKEEDPLMGFVDSCLEFTKDL